MNTADISVLSDELAVTLNPLRRGAHRARAVCAKLAGMAMPWNTEALGAPARPRLRAGTTPARWPFPPVPVKEGTLSGQATSLPVAVPVPAGRPVLDADPVATPITPEALAVAARRERSLGNATVEPVTSQVTMKAMVLDVVMVLAWGAIIPGLMWLGAAAGF